MTLIPLDHTDEPVQLDLAGAMSTRLLLTAGSRQGKSSLLRLIAEGLLVQGIQIIVLDVEGEFATLREVGDVLVLGGDHGEAPLHVSMAPKVAELLATSTTSAVLDLLTMTPQDRDAFVAELMRWWTYMDRAMWRGQRVLLFDEVQELAPQAGKSECKDDVCRMLRLGAKRGFIPICATQRLSTTSKDVTNNCQSKGVGPIDAGDAKRAADLLGIRPSEARELVDQDRGHWTVQGAAFNAKQPTGFQAALPATAPPSPDDDPVQKRRSGSSAQLIKALRAEQKAIDAGDAKTLDQARQTIEQLREQLKAAEAKASEAVPPVVDEAAMLEAVTRAVADRDTWWRSRMSEPIGAMAKVIKESGVIADGVTTLPPAASATPPPAQSSSPKPSRPSQPLPGDLRPQHQKLLDALAWFASLNVDAPTRSNVAVIAGYSPTSSGVPKAFSTLSQHELITYHGEGCVELTDAGRAAAAQPDKPATLKALHAAWLGCSALSPQHRKMLQVLIEIYPSKMTRDDLAVKTGYSVTSSGVPKAVSKLASMHLLDYVGAGVVKASKLLFPEGLR